jgi:hypothetical protein
MEGSENAFQQHKLSKPTSPSRRWSKEEDLQLRTAIEHYGEKNWKSVSGRVGTRTAVQCMHRWSKILKPGLIRGGWTR